jgi:hypothetical protein
MTGGSALLTELFGSALRYRVGSPSADADSQADPPKHPMAGITSVPNSDDLPDSLPVIAAALMLSGLAPPPEMYISFQRSTMYSCSTPVLNQPSLNDALVISGLFQQPGVTLGPLIQTSPVSPTAACV